MLAAINRQPVDRIPTDIWATPEVWEKLRDHFGDDTAVMAGLHIDGMAEVRHCIHSLASDGTGYILAPCHNIQGNTPVENIVAMYDEAWHCGKMS